MTYSFNRRTFLLAAAALPLLPAWAATASDPLQRLTQLESSFAGRLGVVALNTGNGQVLSFRGDERFPLCSTFKAMLAGAILQRSTLTPGLLQKRITYRKSDLVSHSPISEQHVQDGMTVAELCAATIQYSDNGAANLLMKLLDGPEGVTTFARSIGDHHFRLERWETELNTAIPGDLRDTTTPLAMAHSLQKLVLGEALQPPARQQLQDWLRGNTTGGARIRAGVPASWQVGDKTGTGDYGTTNDVAVLWPAGKPPVVLALYLTQNAKDAAPRNETLAQASRIVVDWLG
ncbi:class A beta-lactamase [Pseudomonas turukhanskensis]|uniref:Beta-lactamase n=1 Tax=Pseudomonas turukhanskensis TaxID=1806536 RepID=A0A9W6K6K0_9PSED|nr:class A beta-lactamase [Pseudomonas turukhanskensis]GLK90450.1 beta-lactamase [Pseudomonas turukhanskensis]